MAQIVFVVYIDTGSSMQNSPETITPLKLNLFSFFISGCQHQMKTTCLYVYVSDITLTVR
jgi:hypothetical protein